MLDAHSHAARRSRRRPRMLLSLLLAGLAVPCAAVAADTDRVLLRNGDRLAGEVIELRTGKLEFKTSTMGTVYIEWDKVAELVAPGRFEIETTSGTRFYGSIAAGQNGKMTLVLDVGRLDVDVLAVVRIRPLKATFFDRLDGALDLGASYTQSSGIGQGYLNMDIHARRPKFEWSAVFNTTVTVQPNEPQTSRTVMTLVYSRLLSNRWYIPGTAKFERNTDLGLSLRSSFGGGLGRFLVQTNRSTFGVAGGIMGNREVPEDGEATSNAEAFLGSRYSFFTYDSPKTTVDVSIAVFPSLNVAHRVRSDLDVTLRREIVSDFTVGVTYYDSYDTRPLTADARKHDFGGTVTVGWTF
jgi:hypothetical protein